MSRGGITKDAPERARWSGECSGERGFFPEKAGMSEDEISRVSLAAPPNSLVFDAEVSSCPPPLPLALLLLLPSEGASRPQLPSDRGTEPPQPLPVAALPIGALMVATALLAVAGGIERLSPRRRRSAGKRGSLGSRRSAAARPPPRPSHAAEP